MSETEHDSEYGLFLTSERVKLERNKAGDPVAVIDEKKMLVGHVLSIFPISNRDHFVSLRDMEGQEIGILEEAHELDASSKKVLREELERSHFLPKINDVYSIVERLSLFTFRVNTDKGPRTFEVRNPRRNVRSVGGGRYIIKDVDGNRYDIPRLSNLGPRSQNLMVEFI